MFYSCLQGSQTQNVGLWSVDGVELFGMFLTEAMWF